MSKKWEWEWKSFEGLLVPVMTDPPSAHEPLLHVINCNFSTDWSILGCSCWKNRECSPACGQCRGSACTNSVQPDESESSSEDEDDSWFVCLLLLKLSALLRCLRDECLYFNSVSRILIKTIYEKRCCFVLSLDFILTLKMLLFYLGKYQFRQLKLVIHPYWPFNSEPWNGELLVKEILCFHVTSSFSKNCKLAILLKF